MAEEHEADRIARTEALFREVNERIAESAERFEASATEFICECADPACTTRVETTLDEYEQVREDGTTFLISPGHENPRIEAVIEREGDHDVVRKLDPHVVPVVLALDPRTAA